MGDDQLVLFDVSLLKSVGDLICMGVSNVFTSNCLNTMAGSWCEDMFY